MIEIDTSADTLVAISCAGAIALKHFRFPGATARLTGGRDAAFQLRADDRRVVRSEFANPARPRKLTDYRMRVLLALETRDAGIAARRVVRDPGGIADVLLPPDDGSESAARLFTGLAGEQIVRLDIAPASRRDIGRMRALPTAAPAGFDHSASAHAMIRGAPGAFA